MLTPVYLCIQHDITAEVKNILIISSKKELFFYQQVTCLLFVAFLLDKKPCAA